MKISKKIIASTAVVALIASSAMAQDAFDAESAETAEVTETEAVESSESFGDDFSSDDSFGGFGDDSDFGFGFGGGDDYSSSPELKIGAEVGANAKGFINTDKFSTSDEISSSVTETNAYLNLNLEYSMDSTDFKAKLKLDQSSIKEHPEDVIEEATATGYFGNVVVQAGKMKMVWGKGDKLHVLDNFNANDYSQFIFPDYIDRRLAEPMLSVSYSIPCESTLRFQLVGTPTMTADRFATDGMWQPNKTKMLSESVSKAVSTQLGTLAATKDATYQGAYLTAMSAGLTGLNAVNAAANSDAYKASLANYLTYLSAASALNADSSSLYPDTKQIKYGQFGARATATFGSTDFGLSYYYGHYKQPSVNKSVLADVSDLDAVKANLLHYDQLQVFGFEFARVFWVFNTRAEFAYNLTKDTAGDDPCVKNNSLAWVGGFDVNLPIHNVNINIQETGNYVLKNNKIKDSALKLLDVDYNSDDKYCINKLVVLLSDKFLHDKLTTECKFIWGIENKEYIINPSIDYNIRDGLYFNLSGAYMYSKNENGEFYNFTADSVNHDKAFVQLSAKYEF